ncbi:MAG: RNA helicase [Candidatus Rokubacteria bacterium 13_1_40CM_68_15]|nr:MAG: RNA helicase [Candidatus Rokubacteria bacterium 13_1_40CM_68_15]
MDFATLNLPEPVMQGIRDVGFVAATPIQEATLPLALKGKDVAGQSQTGTGKTAAFLIAAFTRLLRTPERATPGGAAAPRVLVIAPTRELVVQIEADAHQLGRFTPFKIHAVYGGIDYAKQRDTLREGCDVLIGTPGRLIDYLKQHVWGPRRVEVLVVDEADRMFDMGFIADLRFILRRLPAAEQRQSFLFSATLSFRVLELTWEFMNNPTQISITPQQKTAERVEQSLYHVGRDEKFKLLLGLLRREGGDRILIFSNTREEARRLEDRLGRNGWEARALTGDVDQKKRLRILNDFKEGRLPVLVATDVASRGLHIEAVSHVVNWDLPDDAEDYVHRIGRTARAGAGGKAISVVDEASALRIEAIEKFIGQKIPVTWADDDVFVTEIMPTAEERRRYAEERRARLAGRRGPCAASLAGAPSAGGAGGASSTRQSEPPPSAAPRSRAASRLSASDLASRSCESESPPDP